MGYWPLYFKPRSIKQAVECRYYILGVSLQLAINLGPASTEELKKYGREDIKAAAGGVIPAQDYQYLFDGAVASFLTW
jgi:methylmalonyl-CoA mutase